MRDSVGDEERRTNRPARRPSAAAKIDAAAWGLLFIWVGAVWLAHLPLGAALLGTSVIVLGAQVVRRVANLEPETFWLVIGASLAVFGAWSLAGYEGQVIPFLFIAVGLVLLITTLVRARRSG